MSDSEVPLHLCSICPR